MPVSQHSPNLPARDEESTAIELGTRNPLLIVDDRDDDRFLLELMLRRLGVSNPIVKLSSGEQAIAYLAGEQKFADRTRFPLPSVLFLDLKMPLVDGFDVLAWLQAQPARQKVPVIVLTSSNQERDIQQARQMGAHEYRVKPQQFEELVQIVREVRDRWLAHKPGLT